MEVFDAGMPSANQLDRIDTSPAITAADLLQVPDGTITHEGLRTNVAVGVRYLESWLRGNGCVPIFNLMEDAATAEISRAQIWQWIHHPQARLTDGSPITKTLVDRVLAEELAALRESMGAEAYSGSKFDEAGALFVSISTGHEFVDFLTTAAYQRLP